MLFVNLFQIVCFLLLIVKEITCILLPYFSLFIINLPLSYLSLFLFLDLFVKILSHFLFLLLLLSLSSLFILFLFSHLILNVFHHLLILSLNLIFLIFYNRISKWCHNLLNFILSLFFFLLPSLLKFILESCIFLLCFDILNYNKFTSIFSLYASALSLLWF